MLSIIGSLANFKNINIKSLQNYDLNDLMKQVCCWYVNRTLFLQKIKKLLLIFYDTANITYNTRRIQT